MFSSSIHLLNPISDADLQMLAYYLSSRIRAAGTHFARYGEHLSLEMRFEYARYLFSELSWFTTIAGFVRFRVGPQMVMPDCLCRMGRLLLLPRSYGDRDLIAGACFEGSTLPDRILAYYYCNWWDPFNPASNWDGTIEKILLNFRLQQPAMHHMPAPPISAARLSDLTTGEIVKCYSSLQRSRDMVHADTNATLAEITHCMSLIKRFETLKAATLAEEKEQLLKVKKAGLISAGMSEEDAHRFLTSRDDVLAL
ncbi:hypothetical protein BKA70DRAFT_1127129 [Coprinopsis sp. MPI-PUGE-AT-0042]|nr:hypothetical protein BKA70DRAFT_1127129 [Coprinopsis sp. MPI-PUGE-AT-0042]